MRSPGLVLSGLILVAILSAGCAASSGSMKPTTEARAHNKTPPTRLTHEQALHDTRQLIGLLEESHPDPYTAMGGRVAFKRRAQELLSSLPQGGIVVGDLGRRFQDFLAGIGDGHTFIRLGETQSLGDLEATIPVRFLVYDAGLLVGAFDSESMNGTLGFRLLSVNGKTIPELVQELRKHTSVENTYHALLQLKTVITAREHPEKLVPSLRETDSLTFELQSPDGQQTTRIVKHQDHLRAQAMWLQPPKKWAEIASCKAPFCYELLEKESVGYFRVANIMGREAYELALRYGWGDPKKMIERYYQREGRPAPSSLEEGLKGIPSFLEVGEKLLVTMREKGVRKLVIDLRGNGGGVTPMVFPFLYMLFGDRYFAKPPPGEFVTVLSPLYLAKMNTTIDQWRLDRGKAWAMIGDFIFDQDKGGDPIQLRQQRMAQYKDKGLSFAARLMALDGKPVYEPKAIVVVCDEGTYSAAFHFLFYLKHLGAGVVGVPPSQAPNTFMEATPFALAESQIEGSISNSAQIFLPDDARGDVFKSDVSVDYSTFQRYQFNEDTAVRVAIDRLSKEAT